MSIFKQATKIESKLRLAIIGPSGSGKTYTALAIGTALGGSVAVVDTEHGSASKYADLFPFDVAEMHAPFQVQKFITAILEAEKAGYHTVILDSLSHAWMGDGGLLDYVDDVAKRSKSKNSFMAWKEGTPLHNNLVNAIVQSDLHVIATMRSKTEYIVEENSRGKSAPRKVGMAPIQRDGFEYEFDVLLDMDMDNNAIVQKTRCPALTGGVFGKPGEDVAGILLDWLAGAPPETSPTGTNGTGPTQHEEVEYENEPKAEKQTTPLPTDGQCSQFITWARKQDRDGGPCTDDQYKYLVGVINGITGQTTHKDVLKLMLGRDVSSENVPSYALTDKLLDWLPAELGNEKQNTKRANENYNPQYAACVRKLHETIMENSGQKKLIEEG